MSKLEMRTSRFEAIRTAELSLADVYDVSNGALGPLGRVTLLVGPNNVGKSRLLRTVLQTKPLWVRPHGFDATPIAEGVRKFSQLIKSKLQRGIIGYGPLKNGNMFDEYTEIEWLKEDSHIVAELESQLENLIKTSTFGATFDSNRMAPSQDEILTIHSMLQPAATELLAMVKGKAPVLEQRPRAYIPVLRGLRPLGDGSNLYSDRTTKDYRLDGVRVITGSDLYSRIRLLLLGYRHERELVREYEEFVSKEIFQQDFELVPHHKDDVIYARIGDSDERPLYDLGDGIQSIIIMTFYAFIERNESLLIGIEEPETHLHPGQQRRLLEILLTHPMVSQHQVLATTHSNHLLDLAADFEDCSCIVVRKNSEGKCAVQSVSYGDRSPLLELGVRTSSLFLTNATIGVEGPMDRVYIREYIRRYLKEHELTSKYREDIHFSFMEVGGGNVAHYSFSKDSLEDDPVNITKVSPNNFVILDGDNEVRLDRVERLRAELGENLYILKGKEVEHLLPAAVLRAYVVTQLEGADVEELQSSLYEDSREPLGALLDQKFGVTKFTHKATIKNKSGLCAFSAKYLMENDDIAMTTDARSLCERIVAFIASANNALVSSSNAIKN